MQASVACEISLVDKKPSNNFSHLRTPRYSYLKQKLPGGKAEDDNDDHDNDNDNQDISSLQKNAEENGIPLAESLIEVDNRGWITSPLEVFSGGISCVDMHLGVIDGGKLRGNHRHHAKSELLVTWGAKTYWRVEDPNEKQGYREIVVGVNEALAVLIPRGVAHVIKNLDKNHKLNLMGCSDAKFDSRDPKTDYDIWDAADFA